MTINSGGAYQLANDLYGAAGSACLRITASNVVLDCNGYNITSGGSGTYGILLVNPTNNVTVKDCPSISGYGYGIYLQRNANFNRIINNTVWNSSNYGIYLDRASGNNITGNSFHDNGQVGIYLRRSANNNVINNSAQENGQDDLRFYTTGLGHCSNRIENLTGSGNRPINYSNTPVAWSDMVASHIVLCNADNSVLDNVTIRGSDTLRNNGLFLIRTDGSAIKNSNSSDNYHAFEIRYSTNNILTNNTANNNIHGVELYYSDSNNLTNNTANNNIQGFRIAWYSDFNNLTNNTAHNNSESGIHVMEGINNILTNNSARANRYGFEIYQDCNNSIVTHNRAWDNTHGFRISNSRNNSLKNNSAWNNSQYGFYFYFPENNSLVNNTAQENGQFDFFISIPSPSAQHYCNNRVEDFRGSGNRPILYANSTVAWSDTVASQIVLCNADNSVLDNVTIRGSDTLGNNALILHHTDGTTIKNSDSSDNYYGFYFVYSPNNTYINNSARNNTRYGFYSSRDSDNANFTNNRAWDNVDGFNLNEMDDSTMANNSAYNNSRHGFSISAFPNMSSSKTTAHGNANAGIFLESCDQSSSFNDSVFYNNGYDLMLRAPIEGLVMANSLFLNPSGTLENFMNLSINDTVESREAYFVNWTANPYSLPAGHVSFAQKFLNISQTPTVKSLNTPQGGGTSPPSIDSIAWHWTDDEVIAGGYDEAKFGMWKYSLAWTNTSASLDTAANTLSLTDMNPASIYGILESRPSEEGGDDEPSKEDLSATIKSNCSHTSVTVTDGGLVEGAHVVVYKAGVIDGYTDENGVFIFGSAVLCDTSVELTVTADGYPSLYLESIISCGNCPRACGDDEDCRSEEQCQDGRCVPVPCDCGYVENHQCIEYECCADEDCAPTYLCENNLCIPGFECTSDEDCEGSEHCDMAPGAAGGSCQSVTGECGYAEDHAWVRYECGDDEGCQDCPEGQICEDNQCKAGNVNCPSLSYIGDEGECTATMGEELCANCDYHVTDPAGEQFTGRTDENGSILLPFDLEGEYKVALLKDGEVVKEVAVKVIPKAPPEEPEKPVEEIAEDVSWLWLLVVLAVIAVAFLYWRRKEGVKKKRK